MGKFFDAFEKYNKDNIMERASQTLRDQDWQALLRYNRDTGRLNIFDRRIVTDMETPQRLLENELIHPDGRLTDKGLTAAGEQAERRRSQLRERHKALRSPRQN